MALNVQATCSECKTNVPLKGTDIICRVDRAGQTGTYQFTCPECGERANKAMGRDVCRLLKMVVGITWVSPPAELDEVDLDAPMLTHDDLLTFAVALWSASDAEILARAVL